ncbi:STAS domain-containing protein [Actinacidiphila acidipaludis]|uniref:STAS domain-containing protein n=1 Tax=Actinacidiphila acidipaludis TaxID=2873382 RepID=A0ABS7Q717_9ACTN|nr:STAS domain-containing protein [Streptomyces acidipaludis]MBY8878235.1 STAS domain-containing protein [Streptomyces acidipaludis]
MLQVTERSGDRVTARLPEDVDLDSMPKLQAVGDRVIDEGCRHLTLDATDMVYLDSTGTTLLIGWYQRLDQLGGTLSLTQVSGPICDLFLRLGLDSVLTISPRAVGPDAPGT